MTNASGDEAIVRIHNTNTNKIIVSRFALDDGKAAVDGDFVLPGVAGAGAPIRLDFLDPGGAGTGKLLPTGNVLDRISAPGLEPVAASMIDAANPCVFVAAESLGMSGTEMPDELDANHEFLERMEQIRIATSLMMGIAKSPAEAARKPSIPKVAMVAAPRAMRTLSGDTLDSDAADVLVRMLSIGQPHRAVPLTGAMCLAVAARLEGSVVDRIARHAGGSIRIAHPSGVTVVDAEVRRADRLWVADHATVYRTARRLMAGRVFIRASASVGA
jgi:2-methylaconitate cis-trans-isomerase PrpF